MVNRRRLPLTGYLAGAVFFANLTNGVVNKEFEWSYCGPGDKYIRIDKVELTPSKAQPGKLLQTVVEGTTKDSLKGGSVVVDFPTVDVKEDICGNGRRCPLPIGHIRVPFEMTVPQVASVLGGKRVKGTVKVLDDEETEVLCLKLAIPVAGKKHKDTEVFDELIWLDQLLRGSGLPYAPLPPSPPVVASVGAPPPAFVYMNSRQPQIEAVSLSPAVYQYDPAMPGGLVPLPAPPPKLLALIDELRALYGEPGWSGTV